MKLIQLFSLRNNLKTRIIKSRKMGLEKPIFFFWKDSLALENNIIYKNYSWLSKMISS